MRFALGLVIKSLCGSFCIACLHPLTRRYNTESTSCSKRLVELLFVRYFVPIGVQYESYSFRSRYSAVI
ncbi:hypothetical protein HHE95_14805 [Vibrio aestuarianus subsp. francensis]|nr:hypothetical protein [Vibrio aestuarianus subsp. francensis]NLS51025.1 hypothetical protein [Vibrio aestuarianus subsp. francensis]NLS59376.1 hypothetical protein [Vibrio aestuarianus subsp. francensis]NLS66278.1 hypothetical protein [Vibrio aestuarianus subsp. francensis]NLS82923.1 hypothetical protein [Vibrio aestuarianus subsp. francensis]